MSTLGTSMRLRGGTRNRRPSEGNSHEYSTGIDGESLKGAVIKYPRHSSSEPANTAVTIPVGVSFINPAGQQRRYMLML